jgi:hypothetical protein
VVAIQADVLAMHGPPLSISRAIDVRRRFIVEMDIRVVMT